MKKNLYLVGTLAFLLVLTYIFQERRVEKEYVEAQTKDQLIKDDIKHLKLPHFEAEKRNGQWFAGKDLLSINHLSQLEKKLKEIKKIREIEGEWSHFFTSELAFEVNHEIWTLGIISLDKQGFYIAHGKKIYLAFIEGSSYELVQDENQVAEGKLNELKSHLQGTLESYKEKQLFRFFPDLNFERVILKSLGTPGYELDFKKNTTIPNPLPGISVHDDLQGKFRSLFTQMMIQQEVTYSSKPLFNKLGDLKFISAQGDVHAWELWQETKNKANAVLVDHEKKRSFLVVGGTMKVFFTRLQDFWDLKLIPPSEFHSFSTLDVYLSQGKKEAYFKVLNREPLGFEAKGFKIKTQNLQDLFAIVFNLGEWDQANRVSPLSPTERQQVLSEEHLRMRVFNQDLIFWQKSEELIVVNLTQKFKAHFALYKEKLSIRFESMLE